ncbi:hypothetical protein AWN76_003890 [Rhodothermaceae bacterium RA]|nr:hypothetical protein AWN76_003890 [Rhodothermaceae bacterium RA]
MQQIRTILHPTDFSPGAEAAYTQAVALARRYGAEVHLLHAVASFGRSLVRASDEIAREPDLYYRQLWTAADREMQAMIARHEATDVPHRRLHARGLLPAPVILEYAQQAGVDLIVIAPFGSHYQPHMLGSVAAEVLRGAPCPVLISQHAAIEAPPAPMQILLPVDLSQPTEALVHTTAALAHRFNAEVDLLHVMDPEVHVGCREIIPPEAPPGCATADARIRFHVVQGQPSREILKFARSHHTDLIVLASPALSRTKYFPASSLTEHIASAAPCPVLVLRMPTHAAIRRPEKAAVPSRRPILPPGVPSRPDPAPLQPA